MMMILTRAEEICQLHVFSIILPDMKNKLCGAFLLAAAVLHCVLGDYELEVRLHEYNNPTSRCESCGRDGTGRLLCCDYIGIVDDVCEGGERCDNYFVHCFRELGSDGPCISNEFNSSIFNDNDSIQFLSDESSINVSMAGAWQGIQFYTAVMDDDAGMFQLIDNFTIDLNTSFLIPGAGFTARTVYNGTFDLGYLELSFQVSCAENFTGIFCENQLPPEADSLGNTNAVIGGTVGAVIGAIALALILALVLVIVMRKSQQTGSDTKVEEMATPEQRPSKHAEAATEAEIPLSQNPVYGLGKMKMQRNQVYELTKTTPAETGSREYDYVIM